MGHWIHRLVILVHQEERKHGVVDIPLDLDL